MNNHEPEMLTPEEEDLRQLIRGLSRVRADQAFRTRLRREFASGAFAGTSGAEPKHPAAQDPDVARVSRQQRIDRRSHRRIWRWAMLPAAALVLWILFVLGQGPSWTVHRVTGEGPIVVNDEVVTGQMPERLAALIRSEAIIEVPAGVELDLISAQILLLRIMPGSEVEIPQTPRRWLKGQLRSWVYEGEILVKTGPQFTGQHLLVQTNEGQILVTGTTISVYKGGDFTCVCVLAGEALIGKDENCLEMIPNGMRKVMFADDRPPLISEIAPEHEESLIEFEKDTSQVF